MSIEVLRVFLFFIAIRGVPPVAAMMQRRDERADLRWVLVFHEVKREC